jgi:hypothetical protein
VNWAAKADHTARSADTFRSLSGELMIVISADVGFDARKGIVCLPISIRFTLTSKLATKAPEKAKLIELRYFAGLSIQDAATALGISPATAKRHWAFARAWLYAELSRST